MSDHIGTKRPSSVNHGTPADSETGKVMDVSADALQLASLGHKEELGERLLLQYRDEPSTDQTTERNFNLLALAGLGFVCSGSWSGVAQSLVAAILSGGPSVLVYGAYVQPCWTRC